MSPCDPDEALGVFEPKERVNTAGEDEFIDWIRVKAALERWLPRLHASAAA